MLIISRSRQATAKDTEIALRLAATFNTDVLDIPFLYDISEDSWLARRLRSLPEPAYFLVPLAERAVKNLLHYLQIPYAEVFETEDNVQIPDSGIIGGRVERLDEIPKPRWYPIIDHSRCTDCLECVNYCLFGVYNIDSNSRPFVDQPDACRDGCPACARVCPNQAIMFPLYEDRVIAGYELPQAEELDNLIDLVDEI